MTPINKIIYEILCKEFSNEDGFHQGKDLSDVANKIALAINKPLPRGNETIIDDETFSS
jgi:hypothetical protein